jgi:multiple sugar transport system substrate-binding protein
LPPYTSIYADWAKNPPDWLKEQAWVPVVFDQMKVAKAIPNHAFGLQQFVIGQPFWEKYLKGEEPDPKKAMQAAKDAVVAEIKKSS